MNQTVKWRLCGQTLETGTLWDTSALHGPSCFAVLFFFSGAWPLLLADPTEATRINPDRDGLVEKMKRVMRNPTGLQWHRTWFLGWVWRV